jgi:uncharacterized membrane protein
VLRRLKAMGHNLKAFWGWLGRKIGTQFIEGIVTVVPVGAAILILYWIFNAIDNILQPVIRYMWGHTIPGAGFIIAILLIYLVGVLTSNLVGKWLIRRAEPLLQGLPVFRQLYNGIKQILLSFTAPRKTGFMQVVLTEFPRRGMRVIGFITNELSDEPDTKLLTIFIPTSPNPTSGFLQIVRENEVTRTDISVEDALKMIVSAGRVSPKEVCGKLPVDS